MSEFFASFPPHLLDPLRRKIAAEFIRHELRKLLPSVKEASVWGLIDTDVANWFTENILFAPVVSFWNGFHAIARGFRYKNLLPKLTSVNFEWQEKEVLFSELWFGATFEGLEFIGPNPELNRVRDILSRSENLAAKEKLLSILKQKAAASAVRDKDLIIIAKLDGVLRVLDGNRRVFTAMWEDKESIKAYVGEPIATPEIFEQWIPAAFLLDMLSLHAQTPNLTPEFTQTIAGTIARALKTSTCGRQEWEAVCQNSVNPLDMLVYGQVRELLQNKS